METNGEKLAEMIVLHKDIMYNSTLSRQATSLGNKGLHQAMLDAIHSLDSQKVLACIYNPFYTKPLEGVIICSDLELEDKQEMLDLFNNIIEESKI